MVIPSRGVSLVLSVSGQCIGGAELKAWLRPQAKINNGGGGATPTQDQRVAKLEDGRPRLA